LRGIDFSDVENPTSAWISDEYESLTWVGYDNEKVFFGGRNGYRIIAANARTGEVLWNEPVPEFVVGVVTGYGKIFTFGWTGTACMDQNTGQVLWRTPHHGRESGTFALAYNKLYVHESDIALTAYNVEDGSVAWTYWVERESPFPGGPAEESLATTCWASTLAVADGKIYYKSLGHTAYGRLLPPGWVSDDGTMWNPHDYEVLGQPGTGEFACLDAEHGNLIWKCGVDEIGPPGPSIGDIYGQFAVIADGRVYGVQSSYSAHVGVKQFRPYSTIEDYQLINFEWFPPYVYCWGKGPTQFREVDVDKKEVKLGENVTINGKLVDLSPPIDSISILSTYKREVASPATQVPVALSYLSSNGTKVPFANLLTDSKGEFSYTWYPWETGALSIVVESDGNDSYEAPDTELTFTSVEPVMPDLVTILEVALVAAIVVAIAVPVIIIIRKS
jgi:hypothetical protein